MRNAVLSLAALCSLFLTSATVAQTSSQAGSSPAFPSQAPKTTQIITIDQIHAGMRGVAYTVFEGVNPEPMEVEVLGVLRNMNGPKGDVFWSACMALRPSTRAWSPA